MNTTSVAKLLGVSQSTIQRWIKQLDLDMERNELGHYHFNDNDISILKEIQEQIQNGKLLQEVVITDKKVRKGKVTTTQSNPLLKRIEQLERQLGYKADNVVSYQLLSHRRELEDLEKEVHRLHLKIEQLEEKLTENQLPFSTQQKKEPFQEKKKNLFKLLFNF
ncbi:chromosome-anchoring protein RacA [Heyndrickxia sporothermodurans]|nr:chromosome-anchoring protein RacA [Heyndrickxia sporothermodurans]